MEKVDPDIRSSRSITRDLTLGLLLVIFMVSVCIVLLSYFIFTKRIEQEFRNKADEYITHLTKTLEIPLWNFNEESLDKIAHDYFATEFVTKLRIVDSMNNVLFEHVGPDSKIFVERSGDIFHDGKLIGRVEIGLSSRLIEQSNRQTLWSGIIVAIFTIVSVLGATNLLLRRYLRNPLAKLLESMDNIAKGDFSKRLPHTKQREIRTVIERFTHMQKQIKSREGSLTEMNRKLNAEIIERKRIEDELQRSKSLLNETQHLTKTGGWEYDAIKQENYWTDEVYEILGVPHGFEINNVSKLMSLFPENSRNLILNSFQAALEKGKSYDDETKFINARGEDLWIRASGGPIFKNGRVVKVQGYIMDITERKYLEAHLQHAQKMESIGTLAGGVAHEFNNILGIIIGNAELVIDDLSDDSPVHVNLDEIRKACLRARDVVRQILTFSRKTEHKLTPIDLQPVIMDSIRFIRSSLPTTIEIRHNFPAHIDIINGDATQINQVLINLCTNAAYAMRENGGLLEIRVENVEFNKSQDPPYPDLTPGRYVKFTVSDNGVGIGPDIIDRIFDPYFTTKNVGEGSGIGLSLVHAIVKNHNGVIAVDSKPDKGTNFHIFYPTIENEVPREAEIQRPLPRGNERILVVDDEMAIITAVKRNLENLDYKIHAENDPVKALELFKHDPEGFDLIITDMTMPRITGDKLAEEARNIRPDIPIILCTGYSDRINQLKTKSTDNMEFLTKPIEKGEMTRTIRKLLDKQERSLFDKG